MLDARKIIAELKVLDGTDEIAVEDRPAFNQIAAFAEKFARTVEAKSELSAVEILAGLCSSTALELYKCRMELKKAKGERN